MRRWVLLITIFLFGFLYLYHSQRYVDMAQSARYERGKGEVVFEGHVVEKNGKNMIVEVSKESPNGFTRGELVLLRLSEEMALPSYASFTVDLAEPQFRSFKNRHFDYDRYLYSKGITKVYRLKKWNPEPGGSALHAIRITLRDHIESVIETIPHPELLKALVLGMKNEYEHYDRFQKLGISHLLVISGLHFSIVYALVRRLTNFARNRYLQSFVRMIVMFIFFFVVNESYSATRALITIVLLEFQSLRKKKSDVLVSQSLCMTGILLWKPYAVLSTSLHLSFYTYLMIAFGFRKFRVSQNKLLAVIQSSFFIQIATVPITLYYFGEINLYSIIANILCVPIFSALVPMALFSIASNAIPILSEMSRFAWGIMVQVLEFLIDLSPLQPMTIHIASFGMFILCLVIVLMTYIFRSIYKKKWVWVCCICLLMVPIPTSQVEVIVPDVGHGDVTYIRVGGIVGIVDTGDGKMKLVPFLKSHGIQKLDFLVITHAHKDHVGGLHELLNEIQVQKIYLTENSRAKLLMDGELNSADSLVEVKSNLIQKFVKGSEELILVLRRFQCDSDENDNGITLEIESRHFRCAIFGDASTHIIEALPLAGRYDFIKVGHHGSSTSTSRKVYGELDIAFLAVSHSAKYGNPNKELLNNVENSSNRLYSTYYHGELVFDGTSVRSYLDANGRIESTFQFEKMNN